ncbi:MAG: hypothetical protein ACP5RX_00935 [Minisyncoccia bacterium]
MKKIILTLSLCALLGVSLIALADYNGGAPEMPKIPITLWGQNSIITTISNWFFGIVVTIAAIMLIQAAFTYVTSSGNEDKIKSALNTVIYALVGVGVAVLAKGLIYLICTFVSQGQYQCTWF